MGPTLCFLACEAGVGVKPGAPAPGQLHLMLKARETGESLMFREIFRPLARALSEEQPPSWADAPGSTLTPASQATELTIFVRLLTFEAKPPGIV